MANGSLPIPGSPPLPTKELFGTWKGVVKVSSSDIVEEEGFTGTLELDYTIIFHNDGSYREITKLLNEEQFSQNLEKYYVDTLYKEFSALGYNQTQADEAMEVAYGMDVKSYAKKLASAFNYDALLANDLEGVYYVADGKLHSGKKWSGPLESDSYTISGNTLSIESLTEEFPDLILTRSEILV